MTEWDRKKTRKRIEAPIIIDEVPQPS